MNCIAWNCQGLGQSMAVRSLCNLVKVTKPQIVFLSETKATNSYMESIRVKLGFNSGFYVERVRYGGGLTLLWTDSIDLTITGYSHGHIDARVRTPEGHLCRLTGFYGNPKVADRHHSWHLLRRLAALDNLPWLCMGDFNEVMYQFEKDGARPAPLSQMEAFKSAVDDCGLKEVAASNGLFTWFGRRHSTDVREKLDRALANPSWLNLFPLSTVEIQVTTASDHLPLLITFACTAPSIHPKGNFISRFETYWVDDDECREIIDCKWQPRSQTSSVHLMEAIKRTRIALKKWSLQKYGALPRTLNDLRQQLQCLLQGAPSTQQQINELKSQIRHLESMEEKYWSQRSRAEWLRCGDRNTKYFHHKATSRKKHNQIAYLVDDSGIQRNNLADITQSFQSFYENLFTKSNCDLSILQPLQFHQLSVSSKKILEDPYIEAEICKALKDLPATKAPGSDGMHIIFLKRYWDILGQDVVALALDFLNGNGDISALNHTLICLIPKVQQPSRVTDFRPISLCNSIYKLISRVLVNRLKLVLHEVIDDAQSAFVPGRLFTDNAAIACEGFHVLNTQQQTGRKYISIKLDMAKAFDKVQWDYLEAIMQRMAFPANFISRILSCVSSTSLSLIVNGHVTTPFKPSSGIRQGDPLSPFLFILAAEGLSALIRRETQAGMWNELRFGRLGPRVSHLFFADDSLLFLEESAVASSVVQRVLNRYTALSGQCINYQKSMVYFSRNFGHSAANAFCDSLGMVHGCDNSHYLGLPFLIGRSKRQIFQFVTDRVRKKLNGWKEKFLTKAGKEVLIKSVVQAIPNHVMMCFLLPDGICNDITSLIRRFWWGKSSDQQSICWKSWDSMCAPKSVGGMGFKELKSANMSLLAKQGWRMITNPDSLLARVFKVKYFPETDFMNAKLGARPSYLWRSVLGGREVLALGVRYQVGTGQSIHVWEDKWLPQPYTFKPHSLNRHKWPKLYVSDLMIPGDNAWSEQLISDLFFPYEVQSILQIPLCQELVRDKIVWHHTRNGVYTVKSGYTVLQQHQQSLTSGTSGSERVADSIWTKIWNWNTLPKIKHFLWQAAHNILPLGANLEKKVAATIKCPHCSCTNETDQHMFQYCPFARKLWSMLGLTYIWHKFPAPSFFSFIAGLLLTENETTITLIFITLWLLWKERCGMQFAKKRSSHNQMINNAEVLLQESLLTKEAAANDDALTRWHRPTFGIYALNVDASVLADGRVGHGVLIRDSNGGIVSSAAGPLLSGITVENAELLAILKGLQHARELKMQQVMVFSDSQLAINRLKSQEIDWSLLSPLVKQIKLLAAEFISVSFDFVKCQGNLPAHLLAKLALSLTSFIDWGKMPPPDVLHAVSLDSHDFAQ